MGGIKVYVIYVFHFHLQTIDILNRSFKYIFKNNYKI